MDYSAGSLTGIQKHYFLWVAALSVLGDRSHGYLHQLVTRYSSQVCRLLARPLNGLFESVVDVNVVGGDGCIGREGGGRGPFYDHTARGGREGGEGERGRGEGERGGREENEEE